MCQGAWIGKAALLRERAFGIRARVCGIAAGPGATWRSGYAADCKSAYPSSILGVASSFLSLARQRIALDIPAGFAPHPRKSPLTTPWEPLYSRKGAEDFAIGLRVAEAHTNSRGFAHGGMISALSDNAMGLACALRFKPPANLVTVNLAVDFLGSARIGQWLEFRSGFIRTGGTLCFAQCFVSADGEICARANATFRVLAEG
jgi:uncharacterized protein (TIGR00369 family)